MTTSFLLYGAYGYTGELIAREAVARNLQPILAGRDAGKLAPLAEELGCEPRSFPLDRPEAVAAGLAGAGAVLNCAGPFARTAAPMVDACLATGSHYLDITGEMEVFEALARRGEEARAAGVLLLPGVGFDVVPTDCLAAHLHRRLPTATHLVLAFRALGRVSRGTATTMVENLDRGGAVRRRGRIKAVPPAWRRRRVDFGRGPVDAVTVPWGDVATAFHSTGIPNIEVYMAVSKGQLRALRATGWLRPLLATDAAKAALKALARSGAPGPGPESRRRGSSSVWGEVSDASGARARARLHGPEGYRFTVLTALAAVERVLAGEAPPGFQTPSRAFGSDFILTVEGVRREDLE